MFWEIFELELVSNIKQARIYSLLASHYPESLKAPIPQLLHAIQENEFGCSQITKSINFFFSADKLIYICNLLVLFHIRLVFDETGSCRCLFITDVIWDAVVLCFLTTINPSGHKQALTFGYSKALQMYFSVGYRLPLVDSVLQSTPTKAAVSVNEASTIQVPKIISLSKAERPAILNLLCCNIAFR